MNILIATVLLCVVMYVFCFAHCMWCLANVHTEIRKAKLTLRSVKKVDQDSLVIMAGSAEDDVKATGDGDKEDKPASTITKDESSAGLGVDDIKIETEDAESVLTSDENSNTEASISSASVDDNEKDPKDAVPYVNGDRKKNDEVTKTTPKHFTVHIFDFLKIDIDADCIRKKNNESADAGSSSTVAEDSKEALGKSSVLDGGVVEKRKKRKKKKKVKELDPQADVKMEKFTDTMLRRVSMSSSSSSGSEDNRPVIDLAPLKSVRDAISNLGDYLVL